VGAPKGNTNHLKHGFYSRVFKQIESADLAALENDLTSEIAMLRVASRRCFETLSAYQTAALDDPQTPAPMNVAEALNALGLAAVRISSLVRTNSILIGNSSNTLALLMDELIHAQQEQGIKL